MNPADGQNSGKTKTRNKKNESRSTGVNLNSQKKLLFSSLQNYKTKLHIGKSLVLNLPSNLFRWFNTCALLPLVSI